MRNLQARVDQDAQLYELPLDYADKQDEIMLYSTHEEKVSELRYRVRFTRENISNPTHMMRREEQPTFPLMRGSCVPLGYLKVHSFIARF